MSGLPTRIPPQSEPIGIANGKPIALDVNWYLWLYNLSKQVFGTSGGSSTPASPYDILDQANLLAQGADILRAYQGIENLEARLSMQSLADGADISHVRRDSENLAALLSVQSLPDGADIALARNDLANLAARLSIQSLLDGADIAHVRRDLANAMALAARAPLPDPTPEARPVQPVTIGASPFTYTALFDGTLAISAGVVSTVSIIRQGTTVATGITAGLIPLRRLDEVQITYTTAPTVAFLPA